MKESNCKDYGYKTVNGNTLMQNINLMEELASLTERLPIIKKNAIFHYIGSIISNAYHVGAADALQVHYENPLPESAWRDIDGFNPDNLRFHIAVATEYKVVK